MIEEFGIGTEVYNPKGDFMIIKELTVSNDVSRSPVGH
jgi:hypothetical protein